MQCSLPLILLSIFYCISITDTAKRLGHKFFKFYFDNTNRQGTTKITEFLIHAVQDTEGSIYNIQPNYHTVFFFFFKVSEKRKKNLQSNIFLIQDQQRTSC